MARPPPPPTAPAAPVTAMSALSPLGWSYTDSQRRAREREWVPLAALSVVTWVARIRKCSPDSSPRQTRQAVLGHVGVDFVRAHAVKRVGRRTPAGQRLTKLLDLFWVQALKRVVVVVPHVRLAR